ncbi:MAG: FGGY family carbohydrate kinase, partial [Clostridia bacterium]|nr:FGGY family carbohydrate kinase [Clostridia bacterium]
MAYDLGIDLGTTGLKAVIADAGGRIAGIGYREYPLNSPAPNYAEQDPEAWYRAMCLAIGDALGKAALRSADVRCVGFSGQMHGLVLLDGDGAVLCPAIIH